MNRRGTTVLALVFTLFGVIAMVGAAAAVQTSGSLRTVERVQARRLRDRALEAAVDEATAALEAGLADVAKAPAGAKRDLGQTVRWPGRTTTLTSEYLYFPTITAEHLAAAGITFPEPIRLLSTPWEIAWDGAGTHAVERGVLSLSVAVVARVGATSLRSRITVRRQIALAETSGRLHVIVMPGSIGREVVEL